MLNRIVSFFANLWNGIVIFVMSRFIHLKIKVLRKKYADAKTVAEILPEVKVNVGDVAINPEWQWIKVSNPKGRRTGNGFHDFGDSAGIKAGGKLTAVAVNGDQILASYESPKGQGFGSEAGNGTLFFVPTRVFAGMTKRYTSIQAEIGDEKAHVMSLLKATLAAESDPTTPAPNNGAAS